MKTNSLSFLLSFSLLLFLACGAPKDSTTSNLVNSSEQADTSPAILAKTFSKALIENDFKSLDSYMPTVMIARYMLAGKPDTLSDSEIQIGMLKPLKDRLYSNLVAIEDDIENLGIDRAKLKFKSYKYNQTTDPVTVPRVLEIVLDNDGKDVTIPTTVLQIHNKWYLFEILNSYGRFKN